MRCLWLTLADPEPQHNGQYVYSGGLIDSVAATGSEIEVLGLRRPESARCNGTRDEHVVWWLPSDPFQPTQSRWGSLVSPLPHIAYRGSTLQMRRTLRDLLNRPGWDGIVFDGISVGWALRLVRRHYAGRADRPRLIYVSHNHEESVRAQVAESQRAFLRRQAVRLDAVKVSRLERELVDSVDFVTAITPEDLQLYRRRRNDKPMGVITPGYHGRRLAERRISPDLPRRAIIVGSFDWIAKRMNLEEFVDVADPLFAEQRIELQAVGSADERFLQQLRRRTTATRFTGTVPDLNRYLDEARIAIVPERNGGGFKLKVLEYVFNRIPVFALSGSFAGVPLIHNDSVMLFPNHAALAHGVMEAIDDVERLNRLQERAFAACRDRFDWASRGRQILSAIAAS
ncbi:glycosyltransferase [Reyranella sp.]|jgi:glycosyltransferase involved in cell wall biosynthesis|uniref:glycosyltransferase n=1 Tax=Reyranella sp. TaxID=1929291 RepID=UPI002F9307B8